MSTVTRHRAQRCRRAATSWAGSARGSGILAAVEILAVVVAYLAPRKGGAGRGAGLVVAGPVGEFTPASVRAFPAGKFYLVRLADGGFLALSSKCTHLGCTVPWNEKQQIFPCPCHASTLRPEGRRARAAGPRAPSTSSRW